MRGRSWPPQSASACPRPAKRLVRRRRRLSEGTPRALPGSPTAVRQPPPPPLQRARRHGRPARFDGASRCHQADRTAAGLSGDLVPVQQIVKSPPGPRWPLAAAILAFAVAVVLAFVGVGSGPSLGGTVPPGAVEVGGLPSRAGTVPSLDLSNPVVVRVLAQGPAALAAQMSFVLLGHPAFKSSAPLVSVGNGMRAAQDRPDQCPVRRHRAHDGPGRPVEGRRH